MYISISFPAIAYFSFLLIYFYSFSYCFFILDMAQQKELLFLHVVEDMGSLERRECQVPRLPRGSAGLISGSLTHITGLASAMLKGPFSACLAILPHLNRDLSLRTRARMTFTCNAVNVRTILEQSGWPLISWLALFWELNGFQLWSLNAQPLESHRSMDPVLQDPYLAPNFQRKDAGNNCLHKLGEALRDSATVNIVCS